jgi:EamA-like transporter family protein
LKRAGAQKSAVISAIGPVAILFLAWAILGERLNAGQAIGFVFTLGGGIATSLLKESGSSTASAATESQRNLTGDYSWRQNKRVEKGGFRAPHLSR